MSAPGTTNALPAADENAAASMSRDLQDTAGGITAMATSSEDANALIAALAELGSSTVRYSVSTASSGTAASRPGRIASASPAPVLLSWLFVRLRSVRNSIVSYIAASF